MDQDQLSAPTIETFRLRAWRGEERGQKSPEGEMKFYVFRSNMSLFLQD